MSGLIPQEFISELLAKLDIVEVVGSRIKLRRSGSNLMGLCPFHNEKTPSFTVSQHKQFFHCFGCKAHGSAISFLMQFERLGFVEAVETLAAVAGLALPRLVDDYQGKNYTALYDLNEKVAVSFEVTLKKSKFAQAYLKKRGLDGFICKTFRVGYVGNNWPPSDKPELLLSFKKQLITVGLLASNQTRSYLKFRNRVMFPIRDLKGRIVGFGGRAIDNQLAKYLNVSESPIFNKSQQLYGLYEARKSGILNSIIVVEGYLDVISLAQFEITNAVATMGTAISTAQIQLLLRQTEEIIFCFDGDFAGREAAWRALNKALPFMRDGVKVNFLFLPEGEDPDSYVRKWGRSGFVKALNNDAIELSLFFIEYLKTKASPISIDGKAKFAKLAKELLAKLPRGIFCQLLATKVAEVVGLGVENLQVESDFYKAPSVEVTGLKEKGFHPIIKKLLTILLNEPALIMEFVGYHDLMGRTTLEGIEILRSLIKFLELNQQNVSSAVILEHYRANEIGTELANLVASELLVSSLESLKNELLSTLQKLEALEIDKNIAKLLTKVEDRSITAKERQVLKELIDKSKR